MSFERGKVNVSFLIFFSTSFRILGDIFICHLANKVQLFSELHSAFLTFVAPILHVLLLHVYVCAHLHMYVYNISYIVINITITSLFIF